MLSQEIRWAVGRVLQSPARLDFLLGGGVDGIVDMIRFLGRILPLARAELARIEHFAQRIPDEELRAQALSSLRAKAYHVAGACILATFLPRGAREHYVEIVAPLESIYDYLDCLCDRHSETKPQAFRPLHQALADALDPSLPLHEYYAFGPPGDDGDYLRTLVRRTRRALERLSEHELLVPYFSEACALYTDHQTFKHLPAQSRETACKDWHERNRSRFPDLSWFEFGAAAGSQFQVYAPLYAAFCSEYAQIGPAYEAYFPALAALHVMLDSFIDQAEDRAHDELNWMKCYPSFETFVHRAHDLAARARRGFARLGMPRAHEFVLRVMALFYLSHPKIHDQKIDAEALALLAALT